MPGAGREGTNAENMRDPDTQSPIGHCEDFSFHGDGNGEPWNGFEQKRDRTLNQVILTIVLRTGSGVGAAGAGRA